MTGFVDDIKHDFGIIDKERLGLDTARPNSPKFSSLISPAIKEDIERKGENIYPLLIFIYKEWSVW